MFNTSAISSGCMVWVTRSPVIHNVIHISMTIIQHDFNRKQSLFNGKSSSFALASDEIIGDALLIAIVQLQSRLRIFEILCKIHHFQYESHPSQYGMFFRCVCSDLNEFWAWS